MIRWTHWHTYDLVCSLLIAFAAGIVVGWALVP